MTGEEGNVKHVVTVRSFAAHLHHFARSDWTDITTLCSQTACVHMWKRCPVAEPWPHNEEVSSIPLLMKEREWMGWFHLGLSLIREGSLIPSHPMVGFICMFWQEVMEFCFTIRSENPWRHKTWSDAYAAASELPSDWLFSSSCCLFLPSFSLYFFF